jgi:threonine synthase
VASLWRGVIEEYRDRLPVGPGTPVVTLGEGGTPLVHARHLSSVTGCEVWIKVEGMNPTASFKDRGMTMAISRAAQDGAQAVICASTGNTSASAAAYATAAGMTCGVLVPDGKIAMGKLSQAIAHGATLLQVDGNFDDCLTLARKLAEAYPVELVNSVNPYRIEGQKTAAFEVVDVLGNAPDVHCLPVGNAGNITAYWKGYTEYTQTSEQPGPATRTPRMWASRPRGCRRSWPATRSTTRTPSPRRSASATPRPGSRRSGRATRAAAG